ncbi:peptide chain release factor 2 [Candidatus Saccharibacteria bacterium]|nr:peptide chain release factor 2 [Candidatus Saccharibacteria bacterium]MDQ5953659.1 peptide chain release factor 2 [Patescibacteria group bacterium]MDQ5958712.1 peptide chain release factor 2 [Patescibacteria group bacterium]
MDEIIQSAKTLQANVLEAVKTLNLDNDKAVIKDLEKKQQEPTFWDNQVSATVSMQKLSKLTAKVKPWQDLHKNVQDILELASLQDQSLLQDLSVQLKNAQETYKTLKNQLRFNGPYDDHDAILSIFAGAGGTDAQDWAQMLVRMYVRWAEQTTDVSATLIQESAGEEAGIKSATLSISGPLVYGKLKGEHGVHRLVRLSPFNADNLRQTSFAKVDVLPKIDAPNEVQLDEKDLKIDVYRAGGHGGQSVNTTDSAVRVTHLPTNISVAIQNERSQLQNKETALTILRSRLAQLQLEQHASKISELKGPNEQAAWGNQIRNYVLHPYTMVKDTRTKVETTNAQSVLDGNLNDFINA